MLKIVFSLFIIFSLEKLDISIIQCFCSFMAVISWSWVAVLGGVNILQLATVPHFCTPGFWGTSSLGPLYLMEWTCVWGLARSCSQQAGGLFTDLSEADGLCSSPTSQGLPVRRTLEVIFSAHHSHQRAARTDWEIERETENIYMCQKQKRNMRWWRELKHSFWAQDPEGGRGDPSVSS